MTCCSVEEELHVNDTPTFELTIKEYVDGVLTVVDISAATTKTIYLRLADGTTTGYAGSFTTDGTDGKLEYTCTTTEISQEGTLKYRAKVITPAGQWQSSTCEKEVYEEWT